MAYVESATVVYLRRIYGLSDLILDIPPIDPVIAQIEVGRELATLVMLMAVGWAVGKTLQSRIGFTFFIFGIWDIFYYIWLKLFIGWPNSLLSPDILFLIPLPWWGPVIAPLLVACLMVIGGILAITGEEKGYMIRLFSKDLLFAFSGMILILFSFMKDALALLPSEIESLTQLRPTKFNWIIYLIGLAFSSYATFHAILTSNLKNHRKTNESGD